MSSTMAFSLAELQQHFGSQIVLSSVTTLGDAALWIDVSGGERRLAVLARPDAEVFNAFHGEAGTQRDGYVVKFCPIDHANARALRAALPALQPVPLGLQTSAGFGDRLGIATPGHVRALARVLSEPAARSIAPIFAQQSIREMSRTGRTPEDVLTDATWGAFQAGWRGVVGADADHLKTFEDIDACVAAGFSFYTIDPGAYVDSAADDYGPDALRVSVDQLPWDALESTPKDTERRYGNRRFELSDRVVEIERLDAMRAAAKYGRAIAHVVAMYRHLAAKGVPFELEVSVDETESPTSHAEHIYVASELQRLGVRWVSLAPRYVGRFEKGVDYIGDLDELRADLQGHAAIARSFGPYKLSLHSGSDKFSVYPLIVEAAEGMVHLKTAGTSYLEGLRVIASKDAALFRRILGYARERYEEDRASYHVSADLAQVPAPADLPAEQLPALLDDFHAREVLHVTFGSMLARYGEQIMASLHANEEAYAEALEQHFYRHLKPFAQ